VVLVDMKAALRLDAFRGNAGTDDLRQAVDVDRLDPEALFDLRRISSVQGSAPKRPTRSLMFSKPTFISQATS